MDLQYNIANVDELRRRLDPDKVDKALRWAINAESKKAATAISKDIRSVYTIKAGDIKQRLKITRYKTHGRTLLYTGGRLPLSQFKPKTKRVKTKAKSRAGNTYKTTRHGVSLRIRKDKGRKLAPGAFLAKNTVFRRKDMSDTKSDPIPQYGPSIPGMVAHPETINRAQAHVRENLPVQFNDRLEYLLGQR